MFIYLSRAFCAGSYEKILVTATCSLSATWKDEGHQVFSAQAKRLLFFVTVRYYLILHFFSFWKEKNIRREIKIIISRQKYFCVPGIWSVQDFEKIVEGKCCPIRVIRLERSCRQWATTKVFTSELSLTNIWLFVHSPKMLHQSIIVLFTLMVVCNT